VETLLICGYYGRRNAGDEAILGGMLAGLRAFAPDLGLRVVSWNPDGTGRMHGVEAVPWQDVSGLIEAVRAASAVIVGGGGLFHDYWGVDPAAALTGRQAGIAQYAAPILLAQMLGKPSMLYAVGVGPLRTSEGRTLTRDVVAAADLVTVRDLGSRALLAEIGCAVSGVELIPDPAFDLPPAVPDAELEAGWRDIPQPVLGVALRPWLFGVDPARWQAEVAAALDDHLATHGGTALFVPLQDGQPDVEDDVTVGRAVMDRMARGQQAIVAPQHLDPLQRFRLLERCDRVLAMRLHGAIAALRGGHPVAALAYDPKVEALMSEAGVEATSLRPQDWDRAHIVDALAQAAPPRRSLPAGPSKGAGMALELVRRGARAPAAREAALQSLALAKVADVLRLEQIASAQAAEIAQLDLEQRRLHAEIGRLEHERVKQAGELEKLERLRVEQAAEAEALRAELSAQRESGAHRQTEAARRVNELTSQRDEARAQLAALRQTLGVRLLARYWEAVRRALPPGSRRRRLASRLLRIPRREKAGLLHLLSAPAEEQRAADELRAFTRRFEASAPRQAAIILAPTQLIAAEGQRSTHLALELAGRGVPVIFGYWRWDRTDRREQDPELPGILQLPLDELLPQQRAGLSAFPRARRLLLVEFPHPGFAGFIASARGQGWVTLHEVVDDWEAFHRVGQAPWYDRAFELHLLATAEAVTAVSPALVEKTRDCVGRDPALIPNGLRPEVARVDAPHPLERGEVTLGYFGNMTPAWFDWGLVRNVALARPTWRIHLIGFGGAAADLPVNVALHGTLPPSRLAAYAENWDVGIIPFKPSALAEAADPTKWYEYLAMGLPVVVTGVNPPRGMEGLVTRTTGVREFIRECERVSQPGVHPAERGKAYAAQCRWAVRLDQLLALVERGGQRIGLHSALFEAGG